MLKTAVRFDFAGLFMCLRVVDDLRFLPCLCSGQCFLRYGAMTFETQDQVIGLIGGGISLFALSSYWNKNCRVGCPFMPRPESGSVEYARL